MQKISVKSCMCEIVSVQAQEILNLPLKRFNYTPSHDVWECKRKEAQPNINE